MYFDLHFDGWRVCNSELSLNTHFIPFFAPFFILEGGCCNCLRSLINKTTQFGLRCFSFSHGSFVKASSATDDTKRENAHILTPLLNVAVTWVKKTRKKTLELPYCLQAFTVSFPNGKHLWWKLKRLTVDVQHDTKQIPTGAGYVLQNFYWNAVRVRVKI